MSIRVYPISLKRERYVKVSEVKWDKKSLTRVYGDILLLILYLGIFFVTGTNRVRG